MTEMREAYSGDFDRVYPLLYSEFGLGLLNSVKAEEKKESFRRLFKSRWNSPKSYIGYLLEEDNHVVGFLAYIFSQRMINGKTYKFCNLSAWAVKKEFRSFSLMLTQPVKDLKNSGYTITNLLPSGPAYEVFTRIYGFKNLEENVIMIPFLPSGTIKNKYDIKFRNEIDTLLIDQNMKKIAEEVTETKGIPVQILSGEKTTLSIIKKKYFKRYIPVTEILSPGDIEIFNSALPYLRNILNVRMKTFFLMIDGRMINNSVNFSLNVKPFRPKLFWSEELKKDQIDNLYSEALF
jgi:hypothetical protein